MSQRICGVFSLVIVLFLAAAPPSQAQSSDAKALLDEAARAMGGMQALRGLKNQVIESEGKQFDGSLPLKAGSPGRQVATFRYTLTRDLTRSSLRLEWESKTPRAESLRYVEVIDGGIGLLEERGAGAAAKQSRLHPARAATRLREESRAAARLLLVAGEQKSLKRMPDAELEGKSHRVLAFAEGRDEFVVYLDAQTKLPARVDILDDDPLEGDSLYTLRYADWRKVDGVLTPFSLRYELNGKPLQEEQIKSARHNATLAPESLSVPAAVRSQPVDALQIASQWLTRRVATNTSYQDLGRSPPVTVVKLVDGVHLVTGTSHNSVVVEMRDHLVVVEAPLYEDRSQAVIRTLKQRFPAKPIRYIVPTHHHLDHSGGIRGYMAEGAIVVAPTIAGDFYARVARAPSALRPDSLEKNGRAVVIESYAGRYVLTDGSRRVELEPWPTSHAEDYQIVYLPREKILIEADHVSPRKNQFRAGPLPAELVKGIDALKLEVETIVGIHGDTADIKALRAAVKGGK